MGDHLHAQYLSSGIPSDGRGSSCGDPGPLGPLSRSWGRAIPRWAVVGPTSAPRLMAGAPVRSACVHVNPPLSARGPSRAFRIDKVGGVHRHAARGIDEDVVPEGLGNRWRAGIDPATGLDDRASDAKPAAGFHLSDPTTSATVLLMMMR